MLQPWFSASTVFCRYVWLPASVQHDPADQDTQQDSVWDSLNPLKLGTKQLAPPVQMDIRWYDGWSMSNFTGHQFTVREQWHPDPNDGGGDDSALDDNESNTGWRVDSEIGGNST